MPSNSLPGFRVQHTSPIGSQAKPNGNMPREAERKRSTGGANPAPPIARIALTSLPPNNPSRSAVSSQIRLGFTTWAAALINGWRIVGTETITAHHPTVHRGSRATASRMSFAPAPGKMTRVMCGRPTATATTRTFGIQPTDFGSLLTLPALDGRGFLDRLNGHLMSHLGSGQLYCRTSRFA